MTGNTPEDSELGGLIESGNVPPTRFEFRLDDALKGAAQREAEEMGVDLAEFVRQSMVFRLAWLTFVRAILAGANPEGLADIERLSQALVDASQQAQRRPPRR